MPKTKRFKRCAAGCSPDKLPASAFYARKDSRDGLEHTCKACRDKRAKATKDAKADAEAAKILRDTADRTRRMASDHEALKIDDLVGEYDVGVGNVNTPAGKRASAQASAEKRQEFNARMGRNAETLKLAAATAHERGGDVLSGMTAESGAYIGALAEQERRFQNRRIARTISLAQANEALSLAQFKQVAREFLSDKITPVGYAKQPPSRPMKRTAVLLLSDLHIGAELDSLDEPMPFGAVAEARRLEYVMRQAIDYKPQYRRDTKLCVLLNGDVIQGQLGHQIGAGAPLTEQKAAFWMYFRSMAAEFSRAFPEVEWHCQPGNHGRDKQRHPGRATWRKWDGHEYECYFALAQMCSGLKNTTFSVPFKAVSKVNLHGSILGVTHGDTEVKLGHPDTAAEKNARQLDKMNSARLWDCEFAAWAFGHFHTPRYIPSNIRAIFNGALIPPDGHARSEGYIREPCGQFLWEAVEGHPIGDVRFLQLGRFVDNDERLGQIIKPFRFHSQG